MVWVAEAIDSGLRPRSTSDIIDTRTVLDEADQSHAAEPERYLQDVLLDNEPPRDFYPRKEQLLLRGAGGDNTTDSSSSSSHTRVIGGTDAVDGRYPYFVQIWQRSLCGGVLIGPNLVLTAAHCQNAADSVKVGRYNRFGGDNAETISIARKVVHELYDSAIYPHDIMLILLSSRTTKRYPRLNSNNDFPTTATTGLRVLGMGDTNSDSSLALPTKLQEAALGYVTNPVCQQKHTADSVTSDMLCASAVGKDAWCVTTPTPTLTNGILSFLSSRALYTLTRTILFLLSKKRYSDGDSGGPLIRRGGGPSRDVLLGLTSWYVLLPTATDSDN
jgi:Trypsin